MIIQDVLDGRLSRAAGARSLGTSLRTVHSYIKKFREHGLDGLIDRRRGHPRKISSERERQIILLKLNHLQHSTYWIRNRLKLDVSVEAVRLVLAKNHLNRRSLPH